MEQIIESIIRSQHKPGVYDIEKLSMMIKVLFIHFIDWLAKEVTLKLIWVDGQGYVRKWQYSEKGWNSKNQREWSLEELFVFYYNNIFENDGYENKG